MRQLPIVSRNEVEAARPPRTPRDLSRPYGWLVEKELSRREKLEETAVVFLTNRECPLRCVMCDLWKNTLTEPTPRGAVVEQLDSVLPYLSAASQIKLYNSGNFFDAAAIPPGDYQAIAARLGTFHTVIVENHPRFCGPRCRQFLELLPPGTVLEVAIGLEIAHDPMLAWLNKEMTVDDFRRTAGWLRQQGIFVRTFVLLGLPGLDDVEAVQWAAYSVDVAFEAGSDVCCIIPVRAGNGIMDRLAEQGRFHPPSLRMLETALATALSRGRKRVFADLWQVENMPACPQCRKARIENLQRMNLDQQPRPPIDCRCSLPP